MKARGSRMRQGYGRELLPDGSKYTGEWLDDQRSGHGQAWRPMARSTKAPGSQTRRVDPVCDALQKASNSSAVGWRLRGRRHRRSCAMEPHITAVCTTQSESRSTRVFWRGSSAADGRRRDRSAAARPGIPVLPRPSAEPDHSDTLVRTRRTAGLRTRSIDWPNCSKFRFVRAGLALLTAPRQRGTPPRTRASGCSVSSARICRRTRAPSFLHGRGRKGRPDRAQQPGLATRDQPGPRTSRRHPRDCARATARHCTSLGAISIPSLPHKPKQAISRRRYAPNATALGAPKRPQVPMRCSELHERLTLFERDRPYREP